MKTLFSILILALTFSCQEKPKEKIYTPGFGEFMGNVQVHHAKLWFAGKSQNWQLADFEVNEMKENLDGIKEFCKNRPETKSISLIDEPLQAISKAIKQSNEKAFEESYIQLTNSCNECHQSTNHGFNVIKIPDSPPFTNQDFGLKK